MKYEKLVKMNVMGEMFGLYSLGEENLIVFRFEDGKDVIESLEQVAKKHQIQSGAILSGIGMVRDFEISFYSREKAGYVTSKFNEPVELLSLSGNISQCNNQTFLHLHVALAKEDMKAIGGHLKKATVHKTIEGIITKFSKLKLSRDPETRILSMSK